MKIRVIGAILLASAFLSGAVLAEDMSAPVATAVSAIRDAVIANDQALAQAKLAEAKALDGRSAYDDFKIAEGEADTNNLAKHSKATVVALQKLLASPFMAQEAPRERARFTLMLVNTEGSLVTNAPERIVLSKRLIDSGYFVDNALDQLGFAYLNNLDELHAAALATILRDRDAATGGKHDEDIKTLLDSTKGGYKKAALEKAVAAFQAEIAAGEAAYAADNEVSFDLLGCTASHMDNNKLPAKILTLAISPEQGFGAAKWTGDCVNGEAVGAGAVVRRKPLDNGMLYSIFYAPDGLANLTNEEWTNFQNVTERTDADYGHHYLIPPLGTSGGTYDPSYDLSSVPDWARTALERIGVGDLTAEHQQILAAQQQKAQEEQEARDEAQRQAEEAQEQAQQQAQEQANTAAMGNLLANAIMAAAGRRYVPPGYTPPYVPPANSIANNNFVPSNSSSGPVNTSHVATQCVHSSQYTAPVGGGSTEVQVGFQITNGCNEKVRVSFCSVGEYFIGFGHAGAKLFPCDGSNLAGFNIGGADLDPGESQVILEAMIDPDHGGSYGLRYGYIACSWPGFFKNEHYDGTQLVADCSSTL